MLLVPTPVVVLKSMPWSPALSFGQKFFCGECGDSVHNAKFAGAHSTAAGGLNFALSLILGEAKVALLCYECEAVGYCSS